MAIPEKQILQVITLAQNEALSNYDIAEKVFGKRTRESSVRRILKKHREGETLDLDKVSKAASDLGLKVLLFDIETAPAVSYHWSRFGAFIGTDQVIQRPYLITWAAKWLGADEIMSAMLPMYDTYESDPTDDRKIVQDLWKLLDEADIVIAHYGKRFDIPKMNTRFVIHGIKPPSPYKIICTKQMASKFFGFEGNSLNELADHLGVGNKIKTDFTLWRGCMEKDPKSWSNMLEYNEMDVEVLEKVYLKLRAFDQRHPNVSLYINDDKKRCGCCGSENVVSMESSAYTAISQFEAYRCNDCGFVSRGRINQRSKDSMKNTLQNIAS